MLDEVVHQREALHLVLVADDVDEVEIDDTQNDAQLHIIDEDDELDVLDIIEDDTNEQLQ